MKIIDEFKTFAIKGNMVDMAIGIIIGAAFGKIVTSLVNDIIMPPIGVLLGGVNFTDLKLTIKAATEAVPAVTWNYGNFIQVFIDFLIIAVSIFMFIRIINRFHKPAPAGLPAPLSKDQQLLTEIRDALKK